MHIEIKENYNPLYANRMQEVYQSVGWNKHSVKIRSTRQALMLPLPLIMGK